MGDVLNAESSSEVAKRLARALPDTAAWVDTRGMLLSGRASVSGGDTIEAGFVVRAMSGALAVVSVVGFPAHAVIAQAVADATVTKSSCSHAVRGPSSRADIRRTE